MYFSNEALKNMSDMELSVGLECIQAEIQKRQVQKRELLIKKFHEVWQEMKTARISISYNDPEMEIELDDWNGFSFC